VLDKSNHLRKIIIIWLIILPTQLSFGQYGKQSQLFTDIKTVSEYIAFNLPKNSPELKQIDSIYNFALKLKNNDISEALIILTFSTIPYNVLPIRIPLINMKINYPIISAEIPLFIQKNSNLPKSFLSDSPHTDFGDRDKLAHFFGSAFLSYNFVFFDLTNLIGYFVESFEETFVEDAQFDFRDIKINQAGETFGKTLRENKMALPSSELSKY